MLNSFFVRSEDTISEDSTDAVPTRTGAFFERIVSISSIRALYFASLVKTKSSQSSRIMSLCVGMMTTSSPYISLNSLASVSASLSFQIMF